MNTSIALPRIPNDASWPVLEHLGGWYAGHKFGTDFAYVDATGWVTADDGVITEANFKVYNQFDTQIGSVRYDKAAAGDGWSFTAQCKARNANGTGRCQRMALNALCAHHQGWLAS